MKVISKTPPLSLFETSGGIVTFYHNHTAIKQTDTMTGQELTLHQYEQYTLPVRPSPSLAAQIQADYDTWLQKAKDYEFETEAEKVRVRRDRLLDECDIRYCNPERWGAMDEVERQDWRDYKQALRDIPEQDGFPFAVEIPALPQRT